MYWFIVHFQKAMNHPSHYMNNYEESFSSDSSNPTLPLSIYRPHPTLSLHNPNPNPKPNKKPVKSRKNNKAEKISNVKTKKKRSVSDYLILGDGYYNSKDVKEITRRFMEEQQSREKTVVMKVQRLKRKEEKSIRKIEAYIQTFVQSIRINQTILKLNKQQKYQLYTMLKSEQNTHPQPSQSIDQFFHCAVQKLQAITHNIESEYPHKNRTISKWKNFKMHQLSTAKSFLSHQVSQEYNCNFESELEILEQQKFFPELKEDAQQLRHSIINYLKYQQQKQIRVEDEGVKWVLSRLLNFILENEEILGDLLGRLQSVRNLDCELLDSDLFIQFQRQVIGAGQGEQERQQLGYIHIFNKSVVDLVNQGAVSLLGECQQTSLEGALRYVFSSVSGFERERLGDLQLLVRIGDVLFDIILQEALWDFLQYL